MEVLPLCNCRDRCFFGIFDNPAVFRLIKTARNVSFIFMPMSYQMRNKLILNFM